MHIGLRKDANTVKMKQKKPLRINIKPLKGRKWKLIHIFFPEANLETMFLTFGRNIYCALDITKDLLVHERVHIVQQKNSYLWAIWWWIRYIKSPKFRYEQELEAYRAQYRYLCKENKDRNMRNSVLREIATTLSGPMYNRLVSFEQAMMDVRSE